LVRTPSPLDGFGSGWPYNWPYIGPRDRVTVRVNTGESTRATVDGQQVSEPNHYLGG